MAEKRTEGTTNGPSFDWGGVISGCLFHSVMDPEFLLVGASGGVYAILAAHWANCAINYHEMIFSWMRIIILG